MNRMGAGMVGSGGPTGPVSRPPRHIAYQYDPNNTTQPSFNTTISADRTTAIPPMPEDLGVPTPSRVIDPAKPAIKRSKSSWDRSSQDSILERHNYAPDN